MMSYFFPTPPTEISAQAWPTSDPFPEADLVKDMPNVGVAISGGGTRSAAAAIGQLAALECLGIRYRYLSAVSGGSWASTPYVFSASSAQFFGSLTSNPMELTKDRLNTIAKESFGYNVSETEITGIFSRSIVQFHGDETYSRVIGHLFLESHGLNNLARTFTYNATTQNEMDPKFKDRAYLTQPNRPFLIVGACITNTKYGAIPVECTPYYSGVRNHFTGETTTYGGVYVSSYAYDFIQASRDVSTELMVPSDENTDRADSRKRGLEGGGSGDRKRSTEPLDRVRCVAIDNLFTVSDIMGSSGAAPQKKLEEYFSRVKLFPSFHHWYLSDDRKSIKQHEELTHTDGGIIENFGVMPLFARQVERIIVFINTNEPFQYANGRVVQVDSALRSLFIQEQPTALVDYSKNRVLDGGEGKCNELVKALHAKTVEGKTAIHTADYQVLPNSHYGVNKSYKAKITWVYLTRVRAWEERLPVEVRSMIGKSGELERFPHYKTFGENSRSVIDLTRIQVSALSNLTYYSVMENRSEFPKETASPTVLPDYVPANEGWGCVIS